MLKKLLAFILLISIENVSAENFRKMEQQKLSNGTSVIFLESNKTDNCFVTVCLSIGLSDDSCRIPEILGNILKNRIEEETNKDSESHNVEIVSFIGQEQSLISFYGKQEDLPNQIKSIAKHFYNLEISEEELRREKEKICNSFNQVMVSDKNKLRAEALRSLYWHSNLGKPFSKDELNSVTLEQVKEFQNKHFRNNRISLIISGSLKNKAEVIKAIEKNFFIKDLSKMDRLLEPNHHNTTTRFALSSSQVRFPYVEFYWRLPNYKKKASVYDTEESFRTVSPIALEIFLNYLNTELKKSLIDDLKIATDVYFDYSLWTYDEGTLKISIILKEKTFTEETELEILNEIRKLAYEVTKQKLLNAQKEVSESANILNYQTNVIDTMNWFSEKIGVGYEYEFLKTYRKSVREFDLETVKDEVLKFFKRDPEVISVLNPKEEK